MPRKKPRDPLTAYRARNLREQGKRGAGSPAGRNKNDTAAKVLIIAFVIIILVVFYALGYLSL